MREQAAGLSAAVAVFKLAHEVQMLGESGADGSRASKLLPGELLALPH